jgi:hypothetical protein
VQLADKSDTLPLEIRSLLSTVADSGTSEVGELTVVSSVVVVVVLPRLWR